MLALQAKETLKILSEQSTEPSTKFHPFMEAAENTLVGGLIVVSVSNFLLPLIFYFSCVQGYGRADHSITVEKLKKAYPHYASITFSNEGY